MCIYMPQNYSVCDDAYGCVYHVNVFAMGKCIPFLYILNSFPMQEDNSECSIDNIHKGLQDSLNVGLWILFMCKCGQSHIEKLLTDHNGGAHEREACASRQWSAPSGKRPAAQCSSSLFGEGAGITIEYKNGEVFAWFNVSEFYRPEVSWHLQEEFSSCMCIMYLILSPENERIIENWICCCIDM